MDALDCLRRPWPRKHSLQLLARPCLDTYLFDIFCQGGGKRSILPYPRTPPNSKAWHLGFPPATSTCATNTATSVAVCISPYIKPSEVLLLHGNCKVWFSFKVLHPPTDECVTMDRLRTAHRRFCSRGIIQRLDSSCDKNMFMSRPET